ncbi:hypothetical protein H6G97_45975 [Nostoc flagelliforme FACHB-838]|uniref:Uncharacterized protein n=1 Tax=Nostoc flagelliforme FACHB-838 TaxID=2692904 RepID=A0ABR8E4B7_9NOSO|nr:hypothetical protein [Nostoc flagelliforme FACHB-838]
MVEFKALAVAHRYVIKNYLNVSIFEKLTPIAIAQKLLAKIDLKLDYVGRLGSRNNRDCVYQFVAPDDQRDSIFGQWFKRDEASVLASAQNASSDLVSSINNIVLSTQFIDTKPIDIPQTVTQVENPIAQSNCTDDAATSQAPQRLPTLISLLAQALTVWQLL